MQLNEKQVARRLLALRMAADVLQELRSEMPAYQSYIDLAMRRNRMIADTYARQCESMRELSTAERKPPMRVAMSGRRRKKQTPPAGASELVYEPGVGVQRRARCNCGPADTCAICRTED